MSLGIKFRMRSPEPAGSHALQKNRKARRPARIEAGGQPEAQAPCFNPNSVKGEVDNREVCTVRSQAKKGCRFSFPLSVTWLAKGASQSASHRSLNLRSTSPAPPPPPKVAPALCIGRALCRLIQHQPKPSLCQPLARNLRRVS